jgi:hypothetical protein
VCEGDDGERGTRLLALSLSLSSHLARRQPPPPPTTTTTTTREAQSQKSTLAMRVKTAVALLALACMCVLGRRAGEAFSTSAVTGVKKGGGSSRVLAPIATMMKNLMRIERPAAFDLSAPLYFSSHTSSAGQAHTHSHWLPTIDAGTWLHSHHVMNLSSLSEDEGGEASAQQSESSDDGMLSKVWSALVSDVKEYEKLKFTGGDEISGESTIDGSAVDAAGGGDEEIVV